MKPCFVYFLATLVVILNVERNSAQSVAPVKVGENFFFKKSSLQTTVRANSSVSTARPGGVSENFFFKNLTLQTTVPANSSNSTERPAGVVESLFFRNFTLLPTVVRSNSSNSTEGPAGDTESLFFRNFTLLPTGVRSNSSNSTNRLVGILKRFFQKIGLRSSTARPSTILEAAANATRLANVTENFFFFKKFFSSPSVPVGAPLAVPTNGTRSANATAFQDPTCATSGNVGCLMLCDGLGFFNGVCDALGLCSCF